MRLPRLCGTSRHTTPAILAVAVLTATLLAAPAATADPAAALNRCRAGQQGQIVLDHRFTPYNVPSFTINPGDVYRVAYVNGQIKIGQWPWDPSFNPNGTGWSQVAPSSDYPSWPLPGAPRYGLLGAWDGLPSYFWLGANSLCIQWTGITPVRVVLNQNDNKQSDNDGYWDSKIHIYTA